MKTKKKLLAGLIPGTEEYVIKHNAWRRGRGKLNPSECLKNIKDKTEYPKPQLLPGTEPWTRKHNEWLIFNTRPIHHFATITNPKRSLLIAQRHDDGFRKNPEKGADIKYKDCIISAVEKDSDNSYSITTDGWSLGIDTDTIVPKKGDVVRYYGNGVGSVIRGIDIEGVQIRYESERQLRLRYKKESMIEDRRRKDHFKSIQSSLDEKFDALPPAFQKRIERFRQNNFNFRWQHEESEILLAEEALRVAQFLHSQTTLFNKVGIGEVHPQLHWAYKAEVERVYDIFREYTEDDMEKLIPDFGGGHSGNTFYFVFKIAFCYLTDDQHIPFVHGVFSMFGGCLAYGCHRKYSKKEKKLLVRFETKEDEERGLKNAISKLKKQHELHTQRVA